MIRPCLTGFENISRKKRGLASVLTCVEYGGQEWARGAAGFKQLMSAYWPLRGIAGSVATLAPYEGVNDARCDDPDR